MKIKAYHPKLNIGKSFLTRKAERGTSVIAVQNTAGNFKANEILVLGKPGQELTEIVIVESVLDKEITLTEPLQQTHAINTKISIGDWNNVVIYKANSEEATYVEQTEKSIAIDEQYTVYYDPDTHRSRFYKTRFHNTVTDEYSDYSSPMSFAGFPKDSLISMQERILDIFGDPQEQVVHREKIAEWINQGKDDLVNAVAETNEKYFSETVIGGVNNGQENIELAERFKKFQKVSVKHGAIWEELDPIDIEKIHEEDEERYVYAFNNYAITIRPIPTSNTTYKIRQEANQEDLIDDDDRLPKVLRPYSHVLELYALAMTFRSDGKHKIGQSYMQDYEFKKDEMVEQINDINLSHNRSVEDEDDYGY